jgi:hypothetical protein
MMYDHDEIISSGLQYGLTGILGQLNKSRGAEQSALYIARGAWDPDIRCRPFYEDYLGRLYGPDALDDLLKAFLLLEENERILGWHGRRGLFSTWSARSSMGVSLRKVDYEAGRIEINRQELKRAIREAEEAQSFWDGRAAHCRHALELMENACSKIWPGSSGELDYVIYKTRNFITVFELLSAIHEAVSAFDRALGAIDDCKVARDDIGDDPDDSKTGRQLERSRIALDRAKQLVLQAARQMIPFAHIPSERHILWIFNKAIPSHDEARDYLEDVIAHYNTTLKRSGLQ